MNDNTSSATEVTLPNGDVLQLQGLWATCHGQRGALLGVLFNVVPAVDAALGSPNPCPDADGPHGTSEGRHLRGLAVVGGGLIHGIGQRDERRTGIEGCAPPLAVVLDPMDGRLRSVDLSSDPGLGPTAGTQLLNGFLGCHGE